MFGPVHRTKASAGDNLTDELRARGLTTVSKVLKIYDAGFTLGGPIKRDRCGSSRRCANGATATRWPACSGTRRRARRSTRRTSPARRTATQWYESKALRVTWQASTRNKVSFFADCRGLVHLPRAAARSASAPEAGDWRSFPAVGPVSGDVERAAHQRSCSRPAFARRSLTGPTFLTPGVEPTDISILEQSTGIRLQRASQPTATSHERPLRPALSAVVHDRLACLQDSASRSSRAFATALTTSPAATSTTRSATAPRCSITQYATPYDLQNRTIADLGHLRAGSVGRSGG